MVVGVLPVGGEEEEMMSDPVQEVEEEESSGGSEEELDEGSSDGGEPEEVEVSGWADSIAKILSSNKPKNKPELILSRARKDYEVNKSAPKPVHQPKKFAKRKQDYGLEIVPDPVKPKKEGEEADAGDKQEKKEDNKDSILSLKAQRKLELKQKKLELAWENLSRMSAEKTDPKMEKDLVKMATKGVVQLFNAISMQQKTVKSKLRQKKSEFHKDKVMQESKEIFDGALSKSKQKQGELGADSVDIKEESLSEDDEESQPSGNKRKRLIQSKQPSSSKKKPVWSALQDDFMLNANLRDWDKESDSD